MSQEETCTNLGNGSMTGNEAPNKLAGVIGGFGAERGSSTSQSIEDMATLLINTHASLWHFWISDNLSPKRYVYIISDEMIPGLTTCLQIVSDNFDPQKKKKKEDLLFSALSWVGVLEAPAGHQEDNSVLPILSQVNWLRAGQTCRSGGRRTSHRLTQVQTAEFSLFLLLGFEKWAVIRREKKICVHTEDS